MSIPLQVVKDHTGWKTVTVLKCAWCPPGEQVKGFRDGHGSWADGSESHIMCVECRDRIYNEHLEEMKNERHS